MKEQVQKAVSRLSELPALPSVLSKIMSATADPEVSALEIGHYIAADQSLSAVLLKLVNSASYGFYRQINSVSQAIVMLGFVEVRNVALSAATFRAMGGGANKEYKDRLWRHSLATALAAEELDKKLALNISGVFEAGLLHDIGRVALHLLYPSEFDRIVQQAGVCQCSIIEIEEEIFSVNHAAIGGVLADSWNLPPEVAEAISLHHTPEQAELCPELVHLISLANYITYPAELGSIATEIAPDPPEQSIQFLGVSAPLLADITQTLTESHRKIDEFLGALHED